MAPTLATSALAYIKQCKPLLRCVEVCFEHDLPCEKRTSGLITTSVSRGEVSKVVYLMHTYAVLSDCTLVGLDQRPGASAQEVDMPTELEKQDFASLHYRTPTGALVEIAVMRADNELLLHWARDSGDEGTAAPQAIHSVSIPQGKYFTDSDSGVDAYQREHISELMEKFTPGLDLLLQANDTAAASAQGSAASRPQQVDQGRPDDMAAIPAVQLLQAAHPQASPLMDGMPGRGGSHVGPGDPMFAGLIRGRHRLGSSADPPGARFDPIAPDGLPGSHPDDFFGRGQADGWHDVGPPPGRSMPGRGMGPGHGPFGGFM